jgi:hypothetical protein
LWATIGPDNLLYFASVVGVVGAAVFYLLVPFRRNVDDIRRLKLPSTDNGASPPEEVNSVLPVITLESDGSAILAVGHPSSAVKQTRQTL